MLDSNYNFGHSNYYDIPVESNKENVKDKINDKNDKILDFKPHPGWIDHIEIDTQGVKIIHLRGESIQYLIFPN